MITLPFTYLFQAWRRSESNVRKTRFVRTLPWPFRLCEQENKPFRWVAPHVAMSTYRYGRQSLLFNCASTRNEDVSIQCIWSIQVQGFLSCINWDRHFSIAPIQWWYFDSISSPQLFKHFERMYYKKASLFFSFSSCAIIIDLRYGIHFSHSLILGRKFSSLFHQIIDVKFYSIFNPHFQFPRSSVILSPWNVISRSLVSWS